MLMVLPVSRNNVMWWPWGINKLLIIQVPVWYKYELVYDMLVLAGDKTHNDTTSSIGAMLNTAKTTLSWGNIDGFVILRR